jgi:hypothetical protein
MGSGGFTDGNSPGTTIPPTGRSYGFAPQPIQVDTMPYLPTQPILRLSPSRGPSMSNDSTTGPRGIIASSSSGRISNVSSGEKAILTPERLSSPSDASPRGTPVKAEGTRRVTYHTSVAKGEHGIGLDLGEKEEQEPCREGKNQRKERKEHSGGHFCMPDTSLININISVLHILFFRQDI